MKTKISVKRVTKESEISVKLDFSPIKEDYKERINTKITFLNHMIEQIICRSGINIEIDFKMDKFDLKHVVFEDIGMAFGKAVNTYLNENLSYGVKGFANSVGIIDEANSQIAISFENRAYLGFNSKVDIPYFTENTLSEDLETFFDGFCQGAMCTLHINVLSGKNGHHIWEAVFRAFGLVLKDALSICEDRKNLTSGVCGPINYEITAE